MVNRMAGMAEFVSFDCVMACTTRTIRTGSTFQSDESTLGANSLDKKSRTIEAINQLCQCEKNPRATKNRDVHCRSAATLQQVRVNATSAQGAKSAATATPKFPRETLAWRARH